RGPLRLLRPEPRHGPDAAPPGRPGAPHPGADARPGLRGRRRRGPPRPGRRLRQALGHALRLAQALDDFVAKGVGSGEPEPSWGGRFRMTDIQLLIGARKGAWILKGDARRQTWRLEGPMFLGQIINHFVVDPRDGRTMLMAAATGHLGPTILRSTDGGATWTEAARPPAFAKGDPHGRSVNHTFWLEPGHASEPGVWWAGASPPALFRSADGGDTWEGVDGL